MQTRYSGFYMSANTHHAKTGQAKNDFKKTLKNDVARKLQVKRGSDT